MPSIRPMSDLKTTSIRKRIPSAPLKGPLLLLDTLLQVHAPGPLRGPAPVAPYPAHSPPHALTEGRADGRQDSPRTVRSPLAMRFQEENRAVISAGIRKE